MTSATSVDFNVAIMCTGRCNPAMSAMVAFLLCRYREMSSSCTVFLIENGFRGLLSASPASPSFNNNNNNNISSSSCFIRCTQAHFDMAREIVAKGNVARGSLIGSSRARLSNRSHLIVDKLISSHKDKTSSSGRDEDAEDSDPLIIAAKVLFDAKIDVLNAIGSADTIRTCHALSAKTAALFQHQLTVVNVPKTVENDLLNVSRTIGAASAAAAAALFFRRLAAENTANPNSLIIFEVGESNRHARASGWLTAAAADVYVRSLETQDSFCDSLNLRKEMFQPAAIYLPEMTIDFSSEITRLKRYMKRNGAVNIFVAHGAFAELIDREYARQVMMQEQMRRKQEEAEERQNNSNNNNSNSNSINAAIVVQQKRHATLGYTIRDPAVFLKNMIAKKIGAEKVQIFRCPEFIRAAPAVQEDVALCQNLASFAVEMSLKRKSCVAAHDARGVLRPIAHGEVRSGHQFSTATPWFSALLEKLGQPQPKQVAAGSSDASAALQFEQVRLPSKL